MLRTVRDRHSFTRDEECDARDTANWTFRAGRHLAALLLSRPYHRIGRHALAGNAAPLFRARRLRRIGGHRPRPADRAAWRAGPHAGNARPRHHAAARVGIESPRTG